MRRLPEILSSADATADTRAAATIPAELMMQRGELAKARRLLRKLDRLHEQSDLDEALLKPARQGYEHFTKLRRATWAEMDALAAEVWERGACMGLGLEGWLHLLLKFVDMLTTTPVDHHGLTAKRFVLDGMPNIDDNVACPASVMHQPHLLSK